MGKGHNKKGNTARILKSPLWKTLYLLTLWLAAGKKRDTVSVTSRTHSCLGHKYRNWCIEECHGVCDMNQEV